MNKGLSVYLMQYTHTQHDTQVFFISNHSFHKPNTEKTKHESTKIIWLCYFYEEMPELHIVAAGSLLEFAFDEISIPVGRVQ